MKKISFPSACFLFFALLICGASSLSSAQAQSRDSAPIFAAIAKKDVAQIREILADATQLQVTGDYGDTPLHRVLRDYAQAATATRKEIVALLLEKGADVQARTRNR